MKPAVDTTIHDLLCQNLKELESYFEADFLVYFGPILDGNESHLRRIVEQLAEDNEKQKRLFIILTTNGGSASAVERYVNIVRHHYDEVNFIVPDYAYSAGTIFCMSGDEIYMDYFSVLGPIDPQVPNREGKLIPALGYLDKVEEMLKKARGGELTQEEFLILKDLDLGELRAFEQAKELTISLLKKWLVQYKLKNWNHHQSNPQKKGKPVTQEEKEERAEKIADKLSDNNLWKSHGRPINIEMLESEVRLKVNDYSDKTKESGLIRGYYDLLSDYVSKNNLKIFVQTRKFI